MKSIGLFVKYVLIPSTTVVSIFWGGFIVMDNFIIDRAKSVMGPTKVEVSTIKEDIKEIKNRTRNIENILMERNQKRR